MKRTLKVSALLLSLVMLITLTACTKGTEKEEGISQLWENALYTEDTTFGEGEKTVQVEVQADEESVTFTVNTDKETLADAMLEHSLIVGEDGPYGIYIKTVNGISADYDVDGYYWSVCKDGEYLMTGADTTVIADGEHYEFIRTK